MLNIDNPDRLIRDIERNSYDLLFLVPMLREHFQSPYTSKSLFAAHLAVSGLNYTLIHALTKTRVILLGLLVSLLGRMPRSKILTLFQTIISADSKFTIIDTIRESFTSILKVSEYSRIASILLGEFVQILANISRNEYHIMLICEDFFKSFLKEVSELAHDELGLECKKVSISYPGYYRSLHKLHIFPT